MARRHARKNQVKRCSADAKRRGEAALLGCVLPDRAFTKVGDEMTWPSHNDAVSDIEWKLRYDPESMTRHDQLVAASVIAAYRQMVGDSQKKRNAVCKALREAT